MAKIKKLLLKQCHTAEQMIEQLQRLPPKTKIESLDNGVVMVMVNVGHKDEHLNISSERDTCWEPGKSWEPRDA